MSLVIINSSGSYVAPVDAVAITGGNFTHLPEADSQFLFINSDGSYTASIVNAVNVAGSVKAVSAPSSVVGLSGYVSVAVSTAAVASTSHIAGFIVKQNGSVGAIAAPAARMSQKLGNEVYHWSNVNGVSGIYAVVATYNSNSSLLEINGTVSSVGCPSHISSEIVAVGYKGIIDSIASCVSTVIDKNFPKSLCKIHLTLLDPAGNPVGSPSKIPIRGFDGVLYLSDSWNGVKVIAKVTASEAIGDSIIGIDTVSTTTDADGYAELNVLQDLSFVVSCPSFGKTVTVDTTGLDTVDLSSYF